MDAPTFAHPYPGQSVPVGDQCPGCGALLRHWVYNPFSKYARQRRGWVLWHTQRCTCAGRKTNATETRSALAHPPPARHDPR